MKRVRAGISALMLTLMAVTPSAGALAFAPHELCTARHHECGKIAHIVQCCCRDSGSASEPQSGLMPSLHRDLSSLEAASAAGLGSTVAVIADASPLAISPSPARPPDLLINLRI